MKVLRILLKVLFFFSAIFLVLEVPNHSLPNHRIFYDRLGNIRKRLASQGLGTIGIGPAELAPPSQGLGIKNTLNYLFMGGDWGVTQNYILFFNETVHLH